MLFQDQHFDRAVSRNAHKCLTCFKKSISWSTLDRTTDCFYGISELTSSGATSYRQMRKEEQFQNHFCSRVERLPLWQSTSGIPESVQKDTWKWPGKWVIKIGMGSLLAGLQTNGLSPCSTSYDPFATALGTTRNGLLSSKSSEATRRDPCANGGEIIILMVSECHSIIKMICEKF